MIDKYAPSLSANWRIRLEATYCFFGRLRWTGGVATDQIYRLYQSLPKIQFVKGTSTASLMLAPYGVLSLKRQYLETTYLFFIRKTWRNGVVVIYLLT